MAVNAGIQAGTFLKALLDVPLRRWIRLAAVLLLLVSGCTKSIDEGLDRDLREAAESAPTQGRPGSGDPAAGARLYRVTPHTPQGDPQVAQLQFEGNPMDDEAFAALALFSGVNALVGLVIAAVVGFLIGKDASSRGMSGLGWGIFSFLICIVAVPIYLVVRRPRLDERR